MSKNVGARLFRQWRQSKGLSQQGAASLLGIVNFMSISRWERCIGMPARANAKRIEERSGGAVPISAWDTPDTE